MLILQCDVTTVNPGRIKLAKFIIEQFPNEFLKKNPDSTKYTCIILHIQRDQIYISSFNFMCGWKQVTIEALTPQEMNLSTILNGSLADIIKNEYKFEDILKHELLWCLLCIKYPSTPKSVEHIKTLKTDIMKSPLLIEFIKSRVLEWIEENYTDDWDDWQYKGNPDNCDEDNYDELSYDAFENAVQGFSENVKTSLPAINDQVFTDFSEWYFDDFVTVMVANDADKKDSELLAILVQLYIGKDKAFDPVLLHIYWWKHSNIISADLQLAQMCPTVINEFMREGPDISFEEFLVDKVIRMMLDKFAKKGSEPQLDQWQHEVVKILSFSAKILRTNKLSSYQLLRICNDIVSSKLISLPNIKEIIKLGLDSDEQNGLSKKFVDHVLGILSKLEKNEQNLFLQRSFIMRCLDTIPLDSMVRQHLYSIIFSQKDPFPLLGSIITKIFWKEEEAINDPFLRILQDSKEIFQASPRLKVVNSALKTNNLDSSMATLCCDIIQKELFVYMNIPEVARYFRHAVQALLEKTFEPLKRISAIAFLKEFVYCIWYQTLQDDYTQPISFIGIMDIGEFDGDILIEEINNFMCVDNPLIHSLKVYFLRELRQGLSIDDLKRFCVAHTNKFPWLSTFKWNDNKDTRLPFNPYWIISEYQQVENAFKQLYSIGYKAPFQVFLQQLQNIHAFHARIALIGLIMSRLHMVRASHEWGVSEKQAAEFLKIITHIKALHASIPPDSTPLATYFHKIEACQNSFILTTVSDIESLMLSAVITGGGEPITRYVCQCGYMFVTAHCGTALEAIRCPGCKNNTIGVNHRLAASNRKLDNAPITSPIKSKDQTGYIGEQPNNSVDHSVRSMPPSSYRILHLIVHALIGSSAHSQATLNFLRMHNQTATNVEQYCLTHIITDWTVLRQILNCSDENLALLFHSLLTIMAQTPLHASTLKTSAEREEWETQFTQNYVTPLIRSVTETVTNFRTALVAAAAVQGNNANIIESEIDQIGAMDDDYRLSKLPRLWRKIDIVDFNSFRAYCNGDLAQYQIKYPFLAIFFKYFEQLEIIKNLYPIVQFIQILSSRLSYRISRKDAEKMTFDEFINKEADRVELYKMFQKFEDSWNLVIDKVDRYQYHELNDKPEINRYMPIIMGLVEAKDLSIYICAILEYLIGLQNNFLRDVITIPPGSCGSLKFLEQNSLDAEEGTSTITIVTPSQYSIRSLTLNQAHIDNIIMYDQEELGGIHMFSQRNLGIGRGLDVTYDLQKVEIELARQLVFEKVYIDTVDEASLYLPPFSYYMEFIQVSPRILGDIRDLINQEQIPPEQAELLIAYVASLDNPSEVLLSLEILLCFIKRTPGGNGESFIKDYVNQWSTLSGLIENHEFRNLLNKPLRLKHIISLYELIEGQVANLTIDYIHEIYKEELTPKQRDEIENIIDFDTKQPATIVNGEIVKFSAEVFATALKRFSYRFLQNDKLKVTDPLYLYICETSQDFWPPAISELENLDESFPDSLFVNQAFEAYKFVMDQIEFHKLMVS
ncbi:e3 ubiquitin-protein ligase [Gigaspora margarita]|uniref:E3 ubiquitin-protein ligase n=1 Tax=Gigaspora margarita TaxID=4874 RepID=A0A8H4AEU1_GIGMA|nr:e3 ubiquitin-protein ligase [Gigaspora margarita]